MISSIRKDMDNLADAKKAKFLAGYFKTGKGQYAEGDIFLGISVPVQREIAKKYKNAGTDGAEELLKSKVHEHRLVALLILVEKFKAAGAAEKSRIVDFYLKNTKLINNWDLVDLSADKILGAYLLDKDRTVLYKLARSDSIWERRISVVATYSFIKNNKFDDTLKIAEILLKDEHDLIHKAVGWMLREAGKRNQTVEESFLRKHYKRMPRTMLRHAIERFDNKKKEFYMKK